ncbi:MAG: glycosyltransferase family 4 protein [Bacteroidota bacterium]
MADSSPVDGVRRVAMVVFSYYPADPRVRREAEAMVEAGIHVDVVCLQKEEESSHETFNGVGIHRLPVVRRRGTPLRYLWEYVTFVFLASFKLCSLHWRQPYRVVHVHNMPDFLVFTALLPKLNGAKVILDLHDPMPEVFMTKYDFSGQHPIIKVLRVIEKWSIRFADRVLTPNAAFVRLFVSRGCPPSKIHVIMNSPDTRIFLGKGNGSPTKSRNGLVLMYHGTIVERHGLGTALDALVLLREQMPDVVFHVYGEGDYVEEFLSLRNKLGLQSMVQYHGHIPLEQIAEAIDSIDIGLIPNKRSIFTEINLPTRIFEYLSKGKQVIVPRTQGILDYFDDSSTHFFEPGNASSLAAAIRLVCEQPERGREILERGMAIYEVHSWHHQKISLVSVIKELLPD